jgi:tetratricopeptide (TPR) repeat protein
MKRSGMRLAYRRVGAPGLAILLVLGAVLSLSGCKQKQPPPPVGEGGAIRLDAAADIENYKEILRKDPNNLQALIGIGNLYFDTNRDLLAIENYRKALAIDPTNANVRTDMAICYRRSGSPAKAIEELKRAISTTPRHAQSRYNLGVILIQDMHDVEGGIKAWEALLENVPDYPYRDNLKTEIARMRSAQGSGKQVYK